MAHLEHGRLRDEVVSQTGLLLAVLQGGPQVWEVRWPAGRWARRAAHDIVAHRADAAGTVGAAYPSSPTWPPTPSTSSSTS